MSRTTFCSIFLLWLVSAVHCKNYLIEVADQPEDKDTPDPPLTLPDLEQLIDTSLEDDVEMTGEEEISEFESKYESVLTS